MKIKSIKKTNCFKSIEFKEIFPKTIKEETPIINKENIRVFTPNGWQPVLGFFKTKPMKTMKVETAIGSIECAYDHLIETEAGLKKVVDIDKFKIKTIDGLKECKITKFNEEKNLYDVQIPAPHIWYTSGIESHNSILIPHSSIACMKRGANVLHITLELSTAKTALRYAGAMSNIEIHKRFEPQNRTKMLESLERMKNTYKGDLKIYEFPPDEISVDQIYHLISQLRKQENWHPDVLAIDYLELMIARKEADNINDYTKQKQIATQLRGVAKNEDVLVFTATQTNRGETKKGPGGPESTVIGMNRVAESYGKMKPMDYILSANQDMEEYNNDSPKLRLFFAKNRNGQKNQIIHVSINYKTFKMEEVVTNRITKK